MKLQRAVAWWKTLLKRECLNMMMRTAFGWIINSIIKVMIILV